MPNYSERSRSNYYGITGIADVISSVKMNEAPAGNAVLRYLASDPVTNDLINAEEEFEVIIDYKGTRRPPTNDPLWSYYEWQVLTYIWLRSRQPDSRPIAGGLLLFLNELEPIEEDIELLRDETAGGQTDVLPTGADLQNINRQSASQVVLSQALREARSIRVIPNDQMQVEAAVSQFDQVVDTIENCVYNESGGVSIQTCWRPSSTERSCTACDAKTYCTNPRPRPGFYMPTAP